MYLTSHQTKKKEAYNLLKLLQSHTSQYAPDVVDQLKKLYFTFIYTFINQYIFKSTTLNGEFNFTNTSFTFHYL